MKDGDNVEVYYVLEEGGTGMERGDAIVVKGEQKDSEEK
jgi:hypothetical protein